NPRLKPAVNEKLVFTHPLQPGDQCPQISSTVLTVSDITAEPPASPVTLKPLKRFTAFLRRRNPRLKPGVNEKLSLPNRYFAPVLN
ncbi:MAG TPA: hypothetical protein VF074_11195, partial [Pyrinomonadaceae bacterium]